MTQPSLRQRIWGWYFFDWASQPYPTVLVTFIFGPFFAAVAAATFMAEGMPEQAAAARAQSIWAWAMAVFGIVIALCAPVMGAMADSGGKRRPWIIAFSLMYVIGASLLWFSNPDGSNLIFMLLAFGFGFIGAEFALIFINAQLPDLGTKEEVGQISGSGFAFGYIGGLLALAFVLVFLVEQSDGLTIADLEPIFGLEPTEREGTRSVGPFVALWFALFMVPYFLWVKDSHRDQVTTSVSQAISHVISSIRGLWVRRSLGNYLLGSMFYRDGLNGLYTFGGIYATLILNWETAFVGTFGIVSGIGAAALSFAGGFADRQIGPKPVIIFAIWILIGVCITVINITPDSVFGIALSPGSSLPTILFFICGVLIGGMGGVLQAASRSLMVRHCDADTATEYFGLYGLSGRATAFLAPTLVLVATSLTGNAQIGVSPIILLFVLGLIFLRWVQAEGDT